MGLGLFLVALFVGILVLAALFSPEARIKRALRSAARTAIRDARDGQAAKVVGRAVPVGEALRAPLTGRACAFYEVRVEERRRRGKNHHWVTFIHEVEACDFLVDDGTGKALVRARPRPHVAVVKDAHFSSGTFNDASPGLEAFLRRHGRSSQGVLFNKSIRYHEGAIEPGEEVAVLGVARWETDPDPDPRSAWGGYRDAPRRLVVAGAGREGAILLSDDPGTLR